MDNASKNASDMINRLTMQYNRGRQAAITNELVDIITGASNSSFNVTISPTCFVLFRCECALSTVQMIFAVDVEYLVVDSLLSSTSYPSQ